MIHWIPDAALAAILFSKVGEKKLGGQKKGLPSDFSSSYNMYVYTV